MLYCGFVPRGSSPAVLMASGEFFVLISLQQLEQKPVHFKVELPPGDVEIANSVTQSTPLKSEGSAQLLGHSLGEIRVAGRLDVTLTAVCVRCLESTVLPVRKNFDLVYVPNGEPGGGETEVDESAIEVGFYEGSGIELNDVLREVVLLALPMQMTCGEDCKGICPNCGQNRNQSSCDCEQKVEDERWNGLKNLRTIASIKN